MDKYNNRETIKNTSFWSTFFSKTKEGKSKLSYRSKRWITVIAVHALFFLSFFIDLQMLEGTLSGSRFLGFHMTDPFMALEMFLATWHIPINMVIGVSTIVVVYLLVGGRTYCSWVCPYGILSEIGEKWHNILVSKKIIKNRKFDHRVRHVFWAIFLVLSATSGYLVFETFNVVGILSRMIAYGWSVALIWVLVVFLMEVFYSRRVWCTYICPIGTTYGYLSKASALRIEWNDNCDSCMVCHDVCFENQVLEITKAKYRKQIDEKEIKSQYIMGNDCTLCGRCVDVCHVDALNFKFKDTGLVKYPKIFTTIAVLLLTFAFTLPMIGFHGVLNKVEEQKQDTIHEYSKTIWNFYNQGRYKSVATPKEAHNNLDEMIESASEIGAASLPIWAVSLEAPNYPKAAFPEGIPVYFHFDGYSGEVHEMNTINHYVGMDPMWAGGKFEREIGIYALLLLSLGMIYAMMTRSRFLNYMMLIPASLPLLFIADYSFWLYHFGHSLHDWGAFKIKPFMPTVFGDGKIAQFVTHSYPTIGFYIIMAISLFSLLAFFAKRKEINEAEVKDKWEKLGE
jgi:ferredoxin-type protein NapH